MIICPTKSDIRHCVKTLRAQGKTIALVPTMGYLHDGHLALVKRAKQGGNAVIASIFVNPTQFGPNEDLDTYPRDLERDLDLLRQEGVAAVFTPDAAEMYPPDTSDTNTVVNVPSLSHILQGAIRPGHFQGVATVVSKLFNIVQPDMAVFGEKDYQQLTLIRKMVRDLDIPVDIIGHPTVRESDGLAMSSRNVRLSPQDRTAAVVLNQAMNAADAGTAEGLREHLITHITSEPRANIQSIDIRDALTLAPVTGPIAAPVVILLAVRFGTVLLIDQKVLNPKAVK